MSEGGHQVYNRHVYSRRAYRSETGFSHAELLKCLPSAVVPYVVSKLTQSSYAMSFALSFKNRVAYLHLEPEKTREIASIKLPVTAISIEFENFSEIQYRKFMDRFKKYLHRGGG
ncbi:hypothetical protein [Candidatus Spongiihabitans sp.]|uniref:hypothetical protein n=1 Tax=Candidatus Spongiihabitans sp. TaxID=3101308 RepID=UPI003C7D36D3